MKRIKVIFLLVFTSLIIGNSFAQGLCSGMSDEELEEFGAWVCPGYMPSPGFPGSGMPMQLPEVTVVSGNSGGGTTIIGFWPPEFPTVPPGAGTSVDPDAHLKLPCPGDPVENPSIAPSSGWNYLGGTYGKTRNNGTKFHDGIDIKASANTPVYSMYDGVVIGIETSFDPGEYAKRSYGNFVNIKSIINGNVIYLKYNHLNSIGSNIKPGTQVSAGSQIGLSGTTGNASSKTSIVIPHVHIQGRNKDNKSIDPEPYLATKFDHTTGKGEKPC